MVTNIFKILLLLSPICFGAKVYLDMFDMIFFRTGIIVLFMASLIDKPRRELPRKIALSIFVLLTYCVIHIFIYNFAPVVMMSFMNLFMAILGFYILYRYVDINQQFKKFILFAALLNLLFFISQRLGFDPIFNIKTYLGEEGAFLGNKQRLMTYFTLIVPFLPYWLLFIPIALGLYTRQYIIFIPVFLMLLYHFKGRHRIGLGIIFLLFCILIRQHLFGSLAFRFNIAWQPVLKVFSGRPLLGLGLGNKVEGIEVIGSSFLQMIISLGIASIVWLYYIFKYFWREFNIPLINLLLIMCIEYPIEIPRLWYLIIAIILFSVIKKEKEAV